MRLLPVKEYAESIGKSRQWVEKLHRGKKIKFRKRDGKNHVDLDSAEEYFANSSGNHRTGKAFAAEPTNGNGKQIDSGGPLSIEDARERIERHKLFHQSEKER